MKNKITTILDDDIKWELNGMTLPEAISYLQAHLERFGGEALISLGFDEGDTNLRIISKRDETDEEILFRAAEATYIAMAAQRRQEEADLTAFEALRLKLGK